MDRPEGVKFTSSIRMKPVRKAAVRFLFSALCFTFCSYQAPVCSAAPLGIRTEPASKHPFISEFLANNRGGLSDEDGQSADWIELFNPGPEAVSLDGWYLTDSTNQLAKWRVPDLVIANSSYIVLFASGKNRTNSSSRLHTNFRLKGGGGYLALVMPDGTKVASEFRYGPQRKNVSCGVGPNGGTSQRFFDPPTPGTANPAGYTGTVAPPEFTKGRGFFFQPFELTVRAAPGARLLITTDGSEPSLTNAAIIPGTNLTLHLTNTTIVRAAAFRDDWLSSEIETRTYLFPATVAYQTSPPGAASFWPDPTGGVPAHFAIDPRIIKDALPGYELTNALLALPTISVAMANEDLFGANGIYVKSWQSGPGWTRRASIELIYPDGRRGFQYNAGLRLHGGASRQSTFTPKHGFAALFRNEFGSGKLDFPLFPDSPRRKFNRLIFRANSTDSWPVTEWPQQVINGQLRWVRAEATYVRDQWVRDTQREMGQPSAHGNYAHLYLNGLYWGLYNIIERPDDDFATETFGGSEKDYDVISDGTDLHAGDRNAWNQLRAATGLNNNANFQRLLGNDANGARNTNYPVLLDVTNLVDYTILHIFIGADDWPEHNWWVARDRKPTSTGFKFFAWDQEVSVNSLVKQYTAWTLLRGGIPAYAEESWPNTPAEVYSHCRANAEFRQLFADRVQAHLFNDGALSVSNNVARWRRLTDVIDKAVVAESARWGAFRRPERPFRREVEWVATNNWECSVYFPSNHLVALKRFRDAKLFPPIDAPIFNPQGGAITNGSLLFIRNPNASGSIFFTTDGSDPRLPDDGAASAAQPLSQSVIISKTMTVRARVRTERAWSALSEMTFQIR